MERIETSLEGCFILKPKTFNDQRGSLTKIFHQPTFEELGLAGNFKEEYYSISSKGVIRGLHFQIPPSSHAKCIICLAGSIFDVVVDLRKSSHTYGQHFSVILKAEEPTLLYVPEGFAHGFMALEDNSLFLNKSTTVYDPTCDRGIKWDSCGISWPDLAPILSQKDEEMPTLASFISPF
jgi:dTDP-4-dehydrorhamnose 3,5-epimerase